MISWLRSHGVSNDPFSVSLCLRGFLLDFFPGLHAGRFRKPWIRWILAIVKDGWTAVHFGSTAWRVRFDAEISIFRDCKADDIHTSAHFDLFVGQAESLVSGRGHR